MTKFSLATTETQIIEARDETRNYVFSCGVADGAKVIFIRLNDVGDPDLMLDVNGTTIYPISVPGKRRVYAWTNAGTADLCRLEII